MTNFIKRLSLLIVCSCIMACKPQLEVTREAYNFKGQHAPIPYKVYRYPGPISKTLLYLPPALDSLSITAVPAFTKLLDKGYEIIEIQAPSKGEFYALKEMNYASQRASEIINTAKHLKKSNQAAFESLVILGIEEGAYLAPTVAVQLKADTVVYVNGGPFSPLLELERLAQKDSLSAVGQQFIKRHFQLDSVAQLELAVRRVKKTDPNNIILGMQTNKYWLSFNQEQLSSIYTNLPGVNFWLVFDDYPLHQKSNLSYLSLLNKMQGNKHNKIISLKGDGSLQDQNLVLLSKHLEKLLLP